MLDNTGYGPSPSRRGSGNMLTHTIMAALGPRSPQMLLAFYNPGSGGSGISLPGSGAVPAPAPAAPLTGGEQAIVTKVKPGLVIINTDLQFDSEAAEFSTMEPHAFGVQEGAAEILCILDHDGTRTHLGPGGPFPETGPDTGPEEA